MMLGKYIKKATYNTLVFSLSSIISRILSFIFLPYFLSKLSLEEFGIWDFYQVFFSLGTLLLTSSTAGGLTRYYLLYKDNPELQKKTVGNTFLLILVSAILFPIITLFFFSHFFPQHLSSSFFILSIFNVSLFSIFSTLLAYLRVKEYLGSYFFFFCGQNIIATLLTIYGVSLGYRIEIFFLANLISYTLFLPIFFIIFVQHLTFCPSLFKSQLRYTLPLLAYCLIHTLFYNLDRWIIQHYSGFEALGAYSLIWRFGSIFQYIAISIYDAWPVVLYNAQKEKNGDKLIAKLIVLYCVVLSAGTIFSVLISRIAIHWFFPAKYQFLLFYLPFFFLFIALMEITKVFQSGYGLATKTAPLPFLTLMMIGIQSVLLINLQSFGLWGILLCNNITFLLFSYIGYYFSAHVYTSAIFDTQKITKILVLLFAMITLMHILFLHSMFMYSSLCIFIVWLILLYKCVLDPQERMLMLNKIDNMIHKFFQNKPSASIAHLKTLLFLKTDVYAQEIKGGGSHSQTIGELTAFKKNGYKILCAASTMKAILKNLKLDHFQELSVWPLFFFLRWKIGFLRWHADCLFSNLCFYFQTKNLFKKHSIDAIYQCYSWMNFTGLLLSRLKKVPLILEFNGSEVWMTSVVNPKKTLVHKVAEYIENLNLKHADFIVVISEALKEVLVAQGINAEKILVNPNGADTELFNPAYLDKKISNIRQDLHIPQESFLFGYISTFSFWHGIELLTKLIPDIVNQHKNVHFLFIGDGMLKKSMEIELISHGLKNYVTFTGMVDLHTARNYLAMCDAFLCPTQPHKDGSRSFYSPIKLFEYMSLAKPILASDLEQQKELLQPAISFDDIVQKTSIKQHCGILLHPEKITQWLHAISYLINSNNNERQTLGNNARQRILSEYTWDHHINKIKQFVER